MILHNQLKEKPDQLEVRVIKEYGHLPRIECYAGQLNQVFMNILTNAIDALEEVRSRKPDPHKQQENQLPTIRIRTEQSGANRIAISIEDNGSGMSELVQKRLFDPFFTTKPVGKGTGMGMPISHQIVTEKHRGSLKCCSTIGQGTQFLIEIPIRLHV